MDYDKLRAQNDDIYMRQSELIKSRKKLDDSIRNTIDLCQNSGDLILELENQFADKVKINKKDIPFLFFTVSLQILRWFLQPKLDLHFEQIPREERMSANEKRKNGIYSGKRSGGKYEKYEINNYKNSHFDKYIEEVSEYRNKVNGSGRYEYLSWIEILFNAVPYDAMSGSENIAIKGLTSVISPRGKQLYGRNHHVATLGHDPILGWLFGTMNIASGMITFCDLQTLPVIRSVQLDNWEQKIDYLNPSNVVEMFQYCVNSFAEDPKRLPAAVARQAMHIQSDKLTKDGLQIPLLCPELAQKLIDRGWNSNEAERLIKQSLKNTKTVGTQFLLANMINLLIKSIYLFYNADADNIGYSSVKISRILTIANIIAETSNVAVVSFTRDINRLDLGGLLELLRQIAFNVKIRNEVEREFLRNEYYKKVMEV